MSAANDGARATSGDRQDSGITAYGVTTARGVIPGMRVLADDLWMTVRRVQPDGDMIRIVLQDRPVDPFMPAEIAVLPMTWLKVREEGHEYADVD